MSIKFYFVCFFLIVLLSCEKQVINQWDNSKSYIYKSPEKGVNWYDYEELTVTAESVPENGLLTFDDLGLAEDNYTLYEKWGTSLVELGNLIPDYLIVSDFVLISGNFDEFTTPNILKFEYCHQFRDYNYNLDDYYQYYFHNDLSVYEISIENDPVTDLINMDNWVELPVTFQDTLIEGNGILNVEVKNVNAYYVIAVKF